jgi:predicted enzyme related to lactoylglutathione lyase
MLDVFVGDWNNAGQLFPSPSGPGGPAAGQTSYRWGVGGKWLLYTSRLNLPGLGKYVVHGGVAFHKQSGKYDAYAINTLGSLLVYEGEWTDSEQHEDAVLVFTLVHPPPHGRARVVYRVRPDGSFTMTSENATPQGTFAPYFECDFAPRSREKTRGSPLITKIDCVRLYVPDLDAGLAFYRDQLGLDLIWRTKQAIGLGLPDQDASGESCPTEIVLQTERQSPEVDFKVDSADEAAAFIERIGGEILVPPFDIQIGRCVVMQDPWGNELVLLDSSKGLLVTDEQGNVIGNAAP